MLPKFSSELEGNTAKPLRKSSRFDFWIEASLPNEPEGRGSWGEREAPRRLRTREADLVLAGHWF